MKDVNLKDKDNINKYNDNLHEQSKKKKLADICDFNKLEDLFTKK